MSDRESEKAVRYVAALDNARSEDRWNEVPELIRKVTKHAPHRKCLIQAANAEIQLVSHISHRRSAITYETPASPQHPNLTDLIPPLLSAIEEAEGLPQDVFQAKACLGWVHWILSEPSLAVLRLPKAFDGETMNTLPEVGLSLSRWTEVCVVKSCYIKGAAQSLISGRQSALQTFKGVLPWLSAPSQPTLPSLQFLHWSEKLLAKSALLASEEACEADPVPSREVIEIALKSFRLWSHHPLIRQKELPSPTQVTGPAEPKSQLSTWMAYYKLLSDIVQRGVCYIPPSEGSVCNQLSNEMRCVEAICDAVLLSEVRFPRANSNSPLVESWIEQVIRNWEVLCGPDWRDEDLGEGGRNAVSRNVLGILYHAATKTYHSHLILRRLFHVHAALADFELAIKALDSYIDIVIRAKERVEKAAETGEVESDGTLLQTVSEGIILLCCLGSYKEAEKVKSLVDILKKYIEELASRQCHASEADEPSQLHDAFRISPRTMALAYRAIGIGLANWSRWTPVNESRDDIRAEAMEYLERSIAPELGEQDNLSTLYALAILYAETRDLDGAIQHVKLALSTSIPSLNTKDALADPNQTMLSHERDLVPIWHLLALLLSAKHEFNAAGRSCEAAFEQFPSACIVFGHSAKSAARHALEGSHKRQSGATEHAKDFIAQLRSREKERILETRMTQLALMEVLEGPEVALNHSDQLLTLFATLFEDLDLEVLRGKSSEAEHRVPPKSSAGTVRSFRGSLFGRKRGRVLDRRSELGSESNTMFPIRESVNGVDGPMIQVTDEDQSVAQPNTIGRSESLRHYDSHRLHKREGDSTNPSRARSQESKARVQGGRDAAQSSLNATPTKKSQRQPLETMSSTQAIGIAVSDPPSSPESAVTSTPSNKQPQLSASRNMKHNYERLLIGHARQNSEQNTQLSTPHRFESPTSAITMFSLVEGQKQAICVLVRIWLLIAALYRRASLFEDAREACDEAFKQASHFQRLVASKESSAHAFSQQDLGVGRSSEELWGDILAERGALSQAQRLPYDAMEHFEEAIMHCPDHPQATVSLANLLLDIWEEKIPAELPQPTLEGDISSGLSLSEALKHIGIIRPKTSIKDSSSEGLAGNSQQDQPKVAGFNPLRDAPENLNRLAARDRAYCLLSALTKLGSSWDNSEAWFALARAYEAGGQITKAKEVLWWCVELEDRKPIRHWWNLGTGGYVL